MTDTQLTILDDLPPCPCCGGTGKSIAPSRYAVTTRPNDPETSRAAGRKVSDREGAKLGEVRPNTHRHRMLFAFAHSPCTDHEAAIRANLDTPGTCYWKRASELRQGGFITSTYRTRADLTTGADRQVWSLTATGQQAIERLGAPK